jgi:uncharacterized membrane protein
MCDRLLDSSYSISKTIEIQKEAEIEIKRIDSEVAAKLKNLENQKEAVIRVASSFGWIAIIMICLLCTIFLLSDLFMLVSYLKKNYRHKVNKTRKNKLSVNRDILKERESVFRQVIEYNKKLSNHSYFQKRKNQFL